MYTEKYLIEAIQEQLSRNEIKMNIDIDSFSIFPKCLLELVDVYLVT